MTSTKKQNPTIKVIGIGEKMQNTLSSLQTETNAQVQLITKAEELEKLKKNTLAPCVNLLLIITMTDDEYMDWANDLAGSHKNPDRLTLGILITDNADSNNNESDFDGIFQIKKDDLSLNTSYSNKIFTLVNELSRISSINGYINIDLEDVKICLKNAASSALTTAKASGNNRAKHAITKAVDQLTKEHNAIKYANNILLNIYSGKKEANMLEISMIIDYIHDFCLDKKVDVMWGIAHDESLTNELCITLIASSAEQELDKPNKCTSVDE